MSKTTDPNEFKRSLTNLTRSAKQASDEIKKYSHQIWLAGLGAYAKIEKEGNKAFETLVESGEELESLVRGRRNQDDDEDDRSPASTAATSVNEPLQEQKEEPKGSIGASSTEHGRTDDATSEASPFRINQAFGRIESVFDRRLAAALERFGLCSKSEVDELSARVDELSARVQQLIDAQSKQ